MLTEDVINTLLPDEEALNNSEELQLRVKAAVSHHSEQCAALRKDLRSGGENANMTMAQIQENIGELLTQIQHLRTGATESEVIVRDITSDIRMLDIAKRNIVASMTHIKRFQMLANAYDQLCRLARAGRYRESAQALHAVKELSTFFKSFSSVERINILNKGIIAISSDIREHTLTDFKTLFEDKTGSLDTRSTNMLDACAVIDALGPDARRTLINLYCNHSLADYKRIFSPTNEAGALDNLSRRFAWFKRLLKSHEEVESSWFDPEWQTGKILCARFGQLTRDDLKSVLTRAAPSLKVSELLEAIGITKDYENQTARRFNTTYEKLVVADTRSVLPSDAPSTISSVFEPYLGIYVEAQDKTLKEMITTFRNRQSTAQSEVKVLPSSTELFHFYRETLENCAQLSTQSPLSDLAQTYKKYLSAYANDVLKHSLSKPAEVRKSHEGRINIQDLVTACQVINTSEYCADTTTQLEEKMKESLHADYKSRVSFESESELFQSVIATAISSLVSNLESSAIEPSLLAMSRSPWSAPGMEMVSSESAYIIEMVKNINSVFDIVRAELETKRFFRSFCDKSVGMVLTRFAQTIVKCRPIPQIGAEQILLDLQHLRSCLLSLITSRDQPTAPSSYTRYVTKSASKLDVMLQIMITPSSPPEDFVNNYLILIPSQSFSDFQKMLDLKGVKRTDQNNLLDVFLAKTSTMPELEDSSFLSTLDLQEGSIAGIATPNTPNLNTNQSFWPRSISDGASMNLKRTLSDDSTGSSNAQTGLGLGQKGQFMPFRNIGSGLRMGATRLFDRSNSRDGAASPANAGNA